MRRRHHHLLIFFSCSFLPDVTVVAYPSGAPSSACDSLAPGHQYHDDQGVPNGTLIKGQTYDPPFALVVTSVSAKRQKRQQAEELICPCDILLGIQIGTNTSQFQGFLVVALGHTFQRLGSFKFNETLYRSPGCNTSAAGANDAVTHTSKDDKTSVNFQWLPPEFLSENDSHRVVTFVASVALNRETFWIASITSGPYNVTFPNETSDGTEETTMTTTTTTTTTGGTGPMPPPDSSQMPPMTTTSGGMPPSPPPPSPDAETTTTVVAGKASNLISDSAASFVITIFVMSMMGVSF